MRWRLRRSPSLRLAATTLGAIAWAGSVAPASAADTLAEEEVQAVARALGFLESAPREEHFEIAVLYSANASGGEVDAADASARLTGLPGPRRATLRATPYTADDLDQSTGRLDAVLLMPGLSAERDWIERFIRDRRILSVSNDPDCLATETCVVMVNAGRNVEIILDTSLANDVGAQFSTVFTMMVIRR